MFDRRRNSSTRRPWVVGSAIVHSVLVIALLRSGPAVRVRAFVPGTPLGSRIELSYLPGGASTSAVVGKRTAARTHAVPAKNPQLTVSRPMPPHPEQPAATAEDDHSSSSGTAGSSSNDALGTDDIRIALTTYSPSPKPDLSALPHGTQGEVVLDVTIDPTGKVADLQILHALGYGVEGSVAETVRTWTFRPATKDGVAVASVQELHFHFGPV